MLWQNKGIETVKRQRCRRREPDAHSGIGNFDVSDGFDLSAGAGPDV
jgi:hypothetical protein